MSEDLLKDDKATTLQEAMMTETPFKLVRDRQSALSRHLQTSRAARVNTKVGIDVELGGNF